MSRSIGPTLLALFLGGCGQCAFEQLVTGTVVDQDGQPVAGAVLRTCPGENCTAAPTDRPCDQVVADDAGAFELTVPSCAPVGGQCELRPILVSAADCLDAEIQTAIDPGLLSIELVCH